MQHPAATRQYHRLHQGAPALALFVLAPLMGEVVGASLRMSYFVEPLRVAAIVCFYGAGVVLLREIAQRLRLSGWGIILLGVAFGLVEEGLGLQTIFNPVGMDGESVHGRALGVNWFWGVVVVGYHVVWSVLIPIAVVNLVFARRSRAAWLSRPALLLVGVLFAVGTALFALISHLRSDFRLSAVQIVAVLVAVALLTWAASRCTARDQPRVPGRPTGSLPAARVGFGAGAVWLLLYLVAFIGGGISFVWWTLAAALFACAVAALLGHWERRGWAAQDQLAACFGAALAAALFGLLLVSLADRVEDVVFQVVTIGGTVVGYAWGRRRISVAG
ncbi:hypothetical protein J7E99_40390 [Streptomyces sp. ISL-44]|uniref:hypothetical protein n=1 Tax=Streptomyces sp. ISL-44 TaxID=2819184 RepID=UPI001BE94950|nr:hypothetical protein [Streptomyces sp. ISL-44]MBT2546741.1 hypothetical protein [Streptomyces sp. ISL-44]